MALFSARVIAGGFRNLICGNSATANLEEASGNMYRANAITVSPDTGTTGAIGFDGMGSLVSAPIFAYVINNPTTNTIAGLLSRSAIAPKTLRNWITVRRT